MQPALPHLPAVFASPALRYHAPLQNNVYERRAAGAVAPIYKGIAMKPDYDQLLCVMPHVALPHAFVTRVTRVTQMQEAEEVRRHLRVAPGHGVLAPHLHDAPHRDRNILTRS